MKNKFALLTAGFLFTGITFSYAGFSKDDAGTSTAQFLKIGVGGRAAGMGEAYTALSDEANGIFWNPAGLSRIEENEASLMHAVWLEDIAYHNVAIAIPREKNTFGFGINHLTMKGIDKYDSLGNPENKTFTPADLAITLSWSRKMDTFWGFDNYSFGINLKMIQSSIDSKSASALAVDVGDMCDFMDGRLRVAGVIQNIGTKMKFDKKEDPLPMKIAIGSAYKLVPEKAIVSLDINAPQDDDLYLSAGGEYLKNMGSMKLSLRAGYRTNTRGLDGLTGLSAGFGVNMSNLQLDYAWAPYGDLGTAHRISLGLKF